MRPLRWLPLALLACARLLTVHIEQQASTVVEGAGALGVLLDALAFTGFTELDVTVDQELANQGVSDEEIDAAYLTAFTLSTPDGDDLSFLDTFEVYVAADDLDRVRIAHQDDFPEGAPSVDLVLDDVDLAPYIVAPSMTITTEVSGTAPMEDTTVDADIALDVEATPTGACNAAKER